MPRERPDCDLRHVPGRYPRRRPAMLVRRHAILYDIDRWRRFRLPLLLLATGFLLATLLEPVLAHGKGGGGGGSTAPLSFAGAALYGFAFNFWLRQRFRPLA